MWGDVSDRSQEYYQAKQRLDEKESELADLRAETFGTDSAETEDKARSLFENVGLSNGKGRSDEIDRLEEEVSKLRERVTALEEALQCQLTDLRFPFDETIDTRDAEVAFPFIDPLPEETVTAIGEIIRDDVDSEAVTLRESEIAVESTDVEEAIAAVEAFATDIRESARQELDTDEYATRLADREVKIQRLLYELYESDRPLAKEELEARSGVEKGGLRGVLYAVYDRDPYLVKDDSEYELSEMGELVLATFTEQYEKPEIPAEKRGPDVAEPDQTHTGQTEPTHASARSTDEPGE